MGESLAEALPKAIAKASEIIGQQESQARQLDRTLPGAGDGHRLIASLVRAKRNAAVAAMASGNVVAMVRAYEQLKPAMEMSTD